MEIKTIDIIDILLEKIETIEAIETIENKGEETEMVETVELTEISKLEDLSPYNHRSYRLDKHNHQYTFAWTILTHIYRTIIYKCHLGKKFKLKLRNL